MSEFDLKKTPNQNPDRVDFKCFIQYWIRLDWSKGDYWALVEVCALLNAILVLWELIDPGVN